MAGRPRAPADAPDQLGGGLAPWPARRRPARCWPLPQPPSASRLALGWPGRGARGERERSQFAAPAATAAAIPTSKVASRATCQAEGPTTVSLPLPSEPPANAARTPSTAPVKAPEQNPLIGAASSTVVGAARTTSSPPTAPAR